MNSFSSDRFGLAILAIAALSQIPGLRAAARLDIARTVKERTT